jgi:hypothetical protein
VVSGPTKFETVKPQVSNGTIAGLARQMMVIDEELKPVVTPFTRMLRFRVIKIIR